MKRAGIVFLWIYRKEILSLVYLFLIGGAFGAIWIFHDNNAGEAKKEPVFEENHKIIAVVTADTEKPAKAMTTIKEAWKVNSVRVAALVDSQPQISIVIDDLGLLQKRTKDVIKLDAPLTLSFLPYAPNLKNVTRRARDRGHELMIHLPMEPKGDKDPGPYALLTSVSDHKILENLHFNLKQFKGYVGINNHMGSAFTEDYRGLALILNEVQKRGLLVLDSRTSKKSLFAKMAEDRNIPNITRDLFLDNERDVGYILGQLEKLEKMALRRGSAVAIGHPHGETIEALSIWLPTLKEKGIAIVPLSHLVKRKYEKEYLARSAPRHTAGGGQAYSDPY